MAYEPTYWQTGDIVNAEELNNIEEGIVNLDEGKVDKVAGKQLSTEDYTTSEKTKLNRIVDDADIISVQGDWDELDSTSAAYIKNKPGNATQSTAGFMSSSDKTKMDGIESQANKTVVDVTLQDESTNPVQNKVIKEALDALDADKANIDGAYDSFYAGTAGQLISNIKVTDQVPYNHRTAGVSANIGDRLEEMVTGGSLVWNQLMENVKSSKEVAGITFTNNSNGSYTISGTATSNGEGLIHDYVPIVNGHKYLICGMIPSGGTSRTYYYNIWGNNSVNTILDFVFSDTIISISNNYTNMNMACYVTFKNGAVIPTTTLYPQIFDLTTMFGSTIADYIYSLEQANAGAGVAWFRKLFPKPYYEYAPVGIESVKAGEHRTTGFNQWDEEWEVGRISSTDGSNVTATDRLRSKNYIPIVPNTSYFFTAESIATQTASNVYGYFYDADKNYIIDASINHIAFNTPSNAHYMRFMLGGVYGTTFKNDVCINLHWDGERDGEYEPYVKHTYPLDNTLELRGIPKLDGNNQLYYDGDTYESDGTVTRRYGIVDLGTLEWATYETADTNKTRFRSATSVAKPVASATTYGNMICSKYKTVSNADTYSLIVGIGVQQETGRLIIYDTAYDTSSASSFKAAMSGVYLVYELAEPTTETADPYTNPQIVDDWGTEEYIDYAYEAGDRDVAIPVGHLSKYLINLRAKAETAPESPDSDGDYIMRQTNGQNAYVPLTKELPTAPTTDGAYTLKVTVSGGTPTYTWESE